MTIIRRALAAIKASTPNRLPLISGGLQQRFPLLGSGNVESQLNAYAAVGTLFSVVNRISEGLAKVHWRGYVGDREVDDHEALNLWRGVNPFFTQYEFVETFSQHFELVGEAWWVLLRRGREIVEIWPVRPDRIRPIPDRDEYIKGYIYKLGAEEIPLARDDVVFLRRPNPLDPYRGQGLVQTIIADLDGERAATLWNRNFFYNSAEPGGIIQFEQELSDQAWDRFSRRWREMHQGVANAHRVAVLERGTWVDRKYTQRDMQFRDLRLRNRDVVLEAVGMPKHVLGITEDVNRANAEAGEVIFARWLIAPRAERIKQALNERLVPQIDPKFRFEFDDPTPQDREMARLEAVDGYKSGILTLNEARRRLGEDALVDGEGFAPLPAAPPVGERQMIIVQVKAAELPAPVESAEQRMQKAWAKRFSEQGEAIATFLERGGKSFAKLETDDINAYSWDWWALYGEDVVAELAEAFLASIQAGAPDMGPTEAQRLATAWAKARGAGLLKLDGDVSVTAATRERVRELVSQTIANGDSLQTLARAIREDLAFSRERAATVARTETATALGQGSREAAISQGQEEKRWVTQGDSLVEDDCRRNEDAGWIAIGVNFPTGKDTIPQHPRCRCTVLYRHKPVSDVQATIHEPRCKAGHRLPGTDVPVGAKLWCRKCKKEVVI